MQNEHFDALFNSPNEVDIELKQNGEEIFVSNGGRHEIPSKYLLVYQLFSRLYSVIDRRGLKFNK